MKKNIKTFIHKLLDRLGYKIIKNENLINFSLDNFKKSLKGDDLKDLYKNENFFSFISKNYSKSHSQIFQDLFVYYILKKEKGFYCEVGALDGKKFSNTLYLEQELGSQGRRQVTI